MHKFKCSSFGKCYLYQYDKIGIIIIIMSITMDHKIVDSEWFELEGTFEPSSNPSAMDKDTFH